MQHFNSTKNSIPTSEISDPKLNEDGTVTYTYRLNNEIAIATCDFQGCASAGAVSCEGNQVTNLDGSCTCPEGYEYARGRGSEMCVEVPTCADGTFPVPEGQGIVCLCSNNPLQSIAAGAPNTCEVSDRLTNGCGSDPRDDFLAEQVDIERYDSCIATQKQAEIDAQIALNLATATSQAKTNATADLNSKLSNAAQSIAQTCKSRVDSFIRDCSNLKGIPTGNINTSKATAKDQCANLSNTAKEGIESVQNDVNACISIYQGLASACPSKTPELEGVGSGNGNDNSPLHGVDVSRAANDRVTGSTNVSETSDALSRATAVLSESGRGLTDKASKAEEELRKLQEASDKCVAAFKDGPKNENGNSYLNEALGYASKATSFTGGDSYAYSDSYGSSELGSGSTPSGRFRDSYSESSYRNTGSSLDFGNGSISGVFEGDDDPVYSQKNFNLQNQSSLNQGQQPQNGGLRPNLGGGISAGIGQTTSGGKNANAQKRRKFFGSAMERNLVQGYKSVKALQGGSLLSIKPSDYKRYGKSVIQSKLAEAIKLHGEDMPLIFKNGKFVLDFIAMKDKEKFKSRVSAMEKYMKGGSRSISSIDDLPVHQNPKLNLFKLMNFRYQRQNLD